MLRHLGLLGSGVLLGLPLVPRVGHAQALTSAAYCDLMSNHCLEEVLHDEEFCLAFVDNAVPNAIAVGSLTDTSGDTLGCRMHYALAAETAEGAGDEIARRDACEKASLTGGQTCGSFCANYCDLAIQTCTLINNAAYAGTPLFMGGMSPSRSDCETACAGYSEDVLDGISQTEQLFGYGGTVQCRIHHLQAAVVEGQENPSSYGLHCGHASPEANSDLCSDIAEPNVINYCVFALRHCEGDNALFPVSYAHSDCVNFMNSVVASGDYTQDGFESFADSDTNSIGCLNNRIMLAAMDANTYCAEGDWESTNWQPDGAAVCTASVSLPSSAGEGRITLGV
ncbi:MAG: hypothetical protein AAEJ52_05355, partial [Myxococcota bacterium]